MSVSIAKGSSFSGYYASPDVGIFTDWYGAVDVYTSYPSSTSVLSKTLSFDSNTKRLNFTFTTEELNNIDSGLLYLVSNIESIDASISIDKMDYVTLTSATTVTAQPMTTITMTIAKIDGTPAGKETRTLTNTVDGAIVALSWDGVTVTASHPVADEVTGVIVGTETVSTKTNAAGYAQLAVIKGQTVTITCPSFGKSVTVDTTGLDEIDLSSYF